MASSALILSLGHHFSIFYSRSPANYMSLALYFVSLRYSPNVAFDGTFGTLSKNFMNDSDMIVESFYISLSVG